jgi:hypothetical protein
MPTEHQFAALWLGLAFSASIVSVAEAALPVRPQREVRHEHERGEQHNILDEDEIWSNAFAAVLSHHHQTEPRGNNANNINPDDWRRYVREAHDLPDGVTSVAPNDDNDYDDLEEEMNDAASRRTTDATIFEKEEEQEEEEEVVELLRSRWNPGYNHGGDRGRFLVDVDEVPVHQRQALTLSQLLDQDDEPTYRWNQGGAEVPGYTNAAAAAAGGPAPVMTKKVSAALSRSLSNKCVGGSARVWYVEECEVDALAALTIVFSPFIPLFVTHYTSCFTGQKEGGQEQKE